MAYAEKTKVPVGRSQAEIQNILSKHGATGFAFAQKGDQAMVQFEMKDKRIKFMIPIPIYMTEKTNKGYLFSKPQIEQLTRVRWRCLCLSIKAKLEAVESGVESFEDCFMAQILLPNGQTVGEAVLPEIEQSYKNKKMPPLLGIR